MAPWAFRPALFVPAAAPLLGAPGALSSGWLAAYGIGKLQTPAVSNSVRIG
jgi:hypothetical protein